MWSGQVALTPLAVFEPEGSQEGKGASFCCWAAAAFPAKRAAMVTIRKKEDIENLNKPKEFLRISPNKDTKVAGRILARTESPFREEIEPGFDELRPARFARRCHNRAELTGIRKHC